MDLFIEELERMTVNAIDSCVEEEISETDTKRWQKLFNMTYHDAHENIKRYRTNIDRQRLSDELWLEIKTSKEGQGYNREAYEYDLFCRSRVSRTLASSSISNSSKSLRGLLLGGPLDTPEKVRDVAGLSKTPAITRAESEEVGGDTSFCYVTADEEHRIRQGLYDRGIGFSPCFLNVNLDNTCTGL